MRKTLQLPLVASLYGCVAAAPRPDAEGQRVNPIPFSLALEEVVTSGIRQLLPYPASARFGTILAGERTLSGRREIVVCGTVSAKTPSGGADKAFVAKVYPDAGSSFDLVAMSDTTETRHIVGSTCSAAGLPIADPSPKTQL
jgi:hypothetical protein